MTRAEREPPGAVESVAAAIAGLAFGLSLLFVRSATPAEPALFDAGAALLAALGLSPLAHRTLGTFAATTLRGAGLGAALVVVSPAVVAPYNAAIMPAVVAVAGVTLLQANARRAKPTTATEAVGGALLGLALVLALLMAGDFPEGTRLRLALLIGAGVIAAGLAARRILLAHDWESLAPTPLGVVLAATLSGAYLAYRSLVESRVDNLPLYEWTLAAGAAALLLARLRRRAKEREVAESWSGAARRHAQDVRPVYDARMGPIAATIARWLDRGDGYEDYETLILTRAGTTAPPAVATALAAAANARHRLARSPAARKKAAQTRRDAHRAIIAALTTAPRGRTHARTAQSRLR